MSTYPDAIFIGAINYDYIFQGGKKIIKLFRKNNGIDEGAEVLKWNREDGDFDDKLQELYENFTHKSKQIGGSAYLALRAFKAMDSNLKAAYVGVCGKPTAFDIRKQLAFSEKDFAMIDNQEWFFNYLNCESNDELYRLGKAYVMLDQQSTRDHIQVDPCINDELLSLIQDREAKTGERFVDFLAKTRWIHITSFSDFSMFLKIIDYIREAKQINPFLKVSGDLGFDYTKKKRQLLIDNKVFDIFDFIFLNSKEKDNLVINRNGPIMKQHNNFKQIFTDNRLNEQQILVTKYQDKYELYNKIDEQVQCTTHGQQTLSKGEIINDTGAGDFFAGGFIAGMLTDRLLSHQPAPIDVGSIMACERLKVNSIDEACSNAYEMVNRYIVELFQNEELNIKQRRKIGWERLKNSWLFKHAVSFVLGVLASIIAQKCF